MSQTYELSQAKVNGLTDAQLAEYQAYQRAQGVPEFAVAQRTTKAESKAETKADKPKESPALRQLLAGGMTKTKVREQLAGIPAKLVIGDQSYDLVIQDSSSNNVMLFFGGRIAASGYNGALQVSCSVTASKSNELPE